MALLASKPPSNLSKALKPSRANERTFQAFEAPFTKPTFSPNERRKATRERFSRKEENETKQTPFTKSQRSLRTKKGEEKATRERLEVKTRRKRDKKKIKPKQMLQSLSKTSLQSSFGAFESFEKEKEPSKTFKAWKASKPRTKPSSLLPLREDLRILPEWQCRIASCTGSSSVRTLEGLCIEAIFSSLIQPQFRAHQPGR